MNKIRESSVINVNKVFNEELWESKYGFEKTDDISEIVSFVKGRNPPVQKMRACLGQK